VHHAPWPVTEELAFAEQAGAADVLEVAAGVLGAVRREKTNATAIDAGQGGAASRCVTRRAPRGPRRSQT